jgi:hypothetical protein
MEAVFATKSGTPHLGHPPFGPLGKPTPLFQPNHFNLPQLSQFLSKPLQTLTTLLTAMVDYSEQDLQDALAKYHRGGCSIRAVS